MSSQQAQYNDTKLQVPPLYGALPTIIIIIAGILFLNSCDLFKKKDLIYAPFHKTEPETVEAALDAMTLEQKAGQLLLVETEGDSLLERIAEEAARGLIGGLILKGLTVERFQNYSDSLKKNAPIPLFWGTNEPVLLNNQFSDAVPFPGPVSLDACQDKVTGEKIKELYKLQTNFICLNWGMGPLIYAGAVWNPATGLPKDNYALPLKAVKVQSQEGVLSMGRYFSHFVEIPNDTAGLTEKILSPYRKLANAGISGFWIAPEVLDSLSPKDYIRDYFTRKIQFDGLLAGAGDIEAMILAGADVVVWSGDPAAGREIILNMLKQKRLSNADINRRVRRILAAKYWTAKKGGSSEVEEVPDSIRAATIYRLFQSEDLDYQAARLWEKSPVLLCDERGQIPFSQTPLRALALTDTTPFYAFFDRVEKYADLDTAVYYTAQPDSIPLLLEALRPGILLWDSRYTSATADAALFDALRRYADTTAFTLIHFGDMSRLKLADTSFCVIQVFERNGHTEQAAVNVVFGATATQAGLPDAVNGWFPAGAGIARPKVRLRYSTPNEEGINPEKLVGIDAIAGSVIAQKIIPGCQVVVAQNGNIIYSKSFGRYDFNGGPEVSNTSLYDIASITKVAATTLAVMQLKDMEKIGLDNSVQQFLPGAKGKNGLITIRQLLTHTSGLQPNLPIAPYVRSPLARHRACSAYFCKTQQKNYTVEVAKGMYFKTDLRASLLNSLHKLPVAKRAGTRYSDVNMVIVQQVVEKASGRTLDRYAIEELFQPLGLRRTVYRPARKFSLKEIAPTEKDTRWRQQTVHGYVHDPAAALLGGVAGHAGVFSTAEELAVIFQMLLDEGSYGGRRFVEPATVNLFTGADSRSKRGIGFDKPRAVKYPSFSSKMSPESFGHTGFTGACAWVDPQRGLVYIFLSNRVHPKAQNNAFFTNNVRKRIHEVVYEALDTYEPKWGF
ncbi:MAG: serine hydrolase [Saprospiraceae bacterium]|nr:serine hydrolase [Saprospiraceae bacterium]